VLIISLRGMLQHLGDLPYKHTDPGRPVARAGYLDVRPGTDTLC
jgi:hypothetical protein